tara:strand:+ start:2739 stop:3404 length:666 start_codon:yes stop_codon:yes gene_type:complete
MLIEPNSHLYSYAITRDFGFAPNPFHGICTLATCKPSVRKSAKVGDWIMGIGGSNLKLVYRKCIFLMRISEKMSFEDYWKDPRFSLKKPCRNGSRVQMLGDNIYHKDVDDNWIQEDSHHSNPDGTAHIVNLTRDTGRCDQVLISDFFFYFGRDAITVDLNSIKYKRIRDYKKTNLSDSTNGPKLIEKVALDNRSNKNFVISDPYHFMESHKRADQGSGKVT